MKSIYALFLTVLSIVLLFIGCSPMTIDNASIVQIKVEPMIPTGSRQHFLSKTTDGKLLLSWVAGKTPNNRFQFSILEEKGWSAPKTIMQTATKLAAPPRVIGLSNGSLLAAWMTAVKRGDDKYAADIFLSRSDDAGQHWAQPTIPYSAQARVYDAQMSLVALDNEQAVLAWTDTRNLASHQRHQLMAGLIDSNGKILHEITLDDDVCSCCETGIAAKGNDWLVTYRDRLPGEIRDIALVGAHHGELSHKIIHDDHWVINGCPSNGPDIAWKGSNVMLAWFSAADGKGRVRATFSQDNGNTFGPPIELDDNANGYVSVLLNEDGTGIIAWRGRVGAEEELKVAKLNAEGVSYQASVYHGDFPRWPSRHLRLAHSNNNIYVSWSDANLNTVHLAKIPPTEMQTAIKQLQ